MLDISSMPIRTGSNNIKNVAIVKEMEYIVFGWVNAGFSTVSDTFNIFGDAIELSCVR